MNSCPSCWMVWSICRPAANEVGSALRRGPASSSANSRLHNAHATDSHEHADAANAVLGPRVLAQVVAAQRASCTGSLHQPCFQYILHDRL